ncbi:MAG: fatty acid desaturase [Aurantimonas endophytica]|uniref:fatty acid desaturase family protein n=1 Tax=Aurantimonas endophytica TaxID=1522175 RepID=UPI003002C125
MNRRATSGISLAPSYSLSVLKLTLWASGIAALLAAAATASGPMILAIIAGLAILYAHGLELQHEALHGILLPGERANRFAGFVLGAPMLAGFTDTRIRHLHHHRHVGTPGDVFDRSCRDFRSPRALFLHVFEPDRLLRFAGTTMAMAGGRKTGPHGRRSFAMARHEQILLAGLALALLAAGLGAAPRLLLVGWLIPAFVVAPPLHFLMTAAEHLGRPTATRRAEENARSYRAPAVWSYLVNFDNYHVEHHLCPAMPFHRLPRLHAARTGADPETPGLREATSEVAAAIGACRRGS